MRWSIYGLLTAKRCASVAGMTETTTETIRSLLDRYNAGAVTLPQDVVKFLRDAIIEPERVHVPRKPPPAAYADYQEMCTAESEMPGGAYRYAVANDPLSPEDDPVKLREALANMSRTEEDTRAELNAALHEIENLKIRRTNLQQHAADQWSTIDGLRERVIELEAAGGPFATLQEIESDPFVCIPTPKGGDVYVRRSAVSSVVVTEEGTRLSVQFFGSVYSSLSLGDALEMLR